MLDPELGFGERLLGVDRTGDWSGDADRVAGGVPGKYDAVHDHGDGEGGSRTAATTVTVNPPPPPPAAPVVIDRLTIRVNFDTNKSDIRKADIPDLQKATDFVKKYPGYKGFRGGPHG